MECKSWDCRCCVSFNHRLDEQPILCCQAEVCHPAHAKLKVVLVRVVIMHPLPRLQDRGWGRDRIRPHTDELGEKRALRRMTGQAGGRKRDEQVARESKRLLTTEAPSPCPRRGEEHSSHVGCEHGNTPGLGYSIFPHGGLEGRTGTHTHTHATPWPTKPHLLPYQQSNASTVRRTRAQTCHPQQLAGSVGQQTKGGLKEI